MATVLVTGGAGYVGSHCCKAFSQAGWDVVVFDNLSRGWREFVKWGELLEGDLGDQDCLRGVIGSIKPDAVAHFAALAYVGESVEDPDLYYRNNVGGTLNLLQAMAHEGVDQLLFSSTCAVYGEPLQTPMDETHPKQPISPYGWSKFLCEQMMADFGTAHGLRSVALRYFNAAGADPEGEIGERHEPEPHLIPLAIEAALSGRSGFTVFGDDYDTRDGTTVRDYVHVTDLADAHTRAIAYLSDGGASNAFNLGTGTGITVAEIVAAVEHNAGRKLATTIGPRRPGDPAALVAASQKAEAVLGWKPLRSDIELLIGDALEWHRSNPWPRPSKFQ